MPLVNIFFVLASGIIKPSNYSVSWRQNPNPHYLNLPPGWDYAHHDTESGIGIEGPNGELILYPPYGSKGIVASAQRTLSKRTQFLSAEIGGQYLDVAISPKKLLAVSFPDTDYWTEVKSTKQAVVSLMVILTYVDGCGRKLAIPSTGSYNFSSNATFPFESLSKNFCYSYDPKLDSFFASVSFGEILGKSVVFKENRPLPIKPHWKYETKLIGGSLLVIENKDKSYISRFTDKDGKSVTYTARAGNSSNIILAILASITRIRN